MTLVIRHAWLQKHGSPAASRGEFHWYPPDGDRELRSSLVERSRGIDPPAVLWELAPGRVSWAQAFAATAPIDGRRYVGLVLTIAEDAVATTMQLLDALELPPAAPWNDARAVRVDAWSEAIPTDRHAVVPLDSLVDQGGRGLDGEEAGGRGGRGLNGEEAGGRGGRGLDGEGLERDGTGSRGHGNVGGRSRVGGSGAAGEHRAGRARGGVAAGRSQRASDGGASDGGPDDGDASGQRDPDAGPRTDDGELVRIARALLSGGTAVVADPTCGELPRTVAALERWMPEAVLARPRSGVFRAGAAPGTAADPVAALGVAAWRDPISREARAWTLLAELATARDRTVDEVHAELGRCEAPGSALSDAERAALDEPRDFTRMLHAWGRGRLDRIAGSETLPDRLADAVALRVLGCLLGDRDPASVIAEARWHALLPVARRASLLDAVARRAASLRSLVEGDHA